jgi:hypothetical protein
MGKLLFGMEADRDEVTTTPNSLSGVQRMVVTSSVPSRPGVITAHA